jgi:hypothetical protein
MRTIDFEEGYNIVYSAGENVEEALGGLVMKTRQVQAEFEIIGVHGGPQCKEDDKDKCFYYATQALTLRRYPTAGLGPPPARAPKKP